MKKLTPWIIAIVLALGFVYQCEHHAKDVSRVSAERNDLLMKVAHYNAEKLRSDSAVVYLFEKGKADSVKFLNDQKQKDQHIKNAKRKERASRPDTITITKVDTVYALYDDLVKNLKQERDTIRTNKNQQISTLRSQAFKSDSAFQSTKKKLIDAEDELNSQSPWGLGISAGPAVMATGGELRTGISIQAGLTYKIPLKLRLKKLFKRKRR
jgi:ElaB/YqjD/DUF883 family membrane-anchored ribosome-binding protein